MKYLNVSDFHFAIKHINDSVMCADSVTIAARKHEVDFITIPGDWFDSPIMATNKGGLKTAKRIIKEWLDICPVIAIEGTPSHDAPGCYGIFEDMGLVVAQPDKVYGFFDGPDTGYNSIIKHLDFNNGFTGKPEAIIFGIPELNKHNIQAQLNLPAEQANAEALNLLDQHITEFVAPMRLKYKELPAIGLLHGNVTDSISKEFENDNILKRSDILISTEILAKADLTIWNLGHIHTPWQSKKITAGYAGSPCFDWKQSGFLPGFELISIENDMDIADSNGNIATLEFSPGISRIPYGTPRREKVKLPFSNFEDGIAYEIETDDLDYKIPDNVHPWSRIRRPENKRETKRVSEEQIKNIKSLWDLFKLLDPKVPKKYKKFVDLITDKVKTEINKKLNIEMTYLQVKGCTFFKGKTYTLNINELQEGLNCIHGQNGTGKSSGFSFCSPFPNIIGKDTFSGRPSAIQPFFSGPECSIKKQFLINGVLHEHFIVIAKAHTQNPKVECSLTVDGIPQLDKGTFDEMFTECEKLYGLFEDYRITTFYEQPQQAKNNQSGLMSCGRPDARNVVQHIADVDRETEKRFALDQAAETEKKHVDIEAGIKAKKEYLDDPEEINKQIENLDALISAEKEKLEKTVNDGNVLKKSLDMLSESKKENDIKKEQLKQKQELLIKVKADIIAYELQIENCESAMTGMEVNKKALADNAKNKKRYDELKEQQLEIVNSNNILEKEFLNKKADYQKLVNSHNGCKALIENAKEKIQTLETMIEQTKQPCEKCGHIAESAQQIINKYSDQIKERKQEIISAEKNMLDLPESPTEPEYKIFDSTELDSINLIDTEEIQEKINKAIRAEAALEEFEKSIVSNSSEMKELEKEISEITISETIDDAFEDIKTNLEATRKEYTDIKTTLTGYESDLKHVNEKLDLITAKKKELEEDEKKLVTLQDDLEAWKYISMMLSANKIPALELDVIVESIDTYATRNLKPFHNGRYSVRTSTQEMGKNSMVDKFDILIHDSETGKEQSIFFMNPGHKAFFSDSYVKALIEKRNEKSFISYSPIILDEADSPIDTFQIPAFYEIQNDYFADKKVLITTHSSDAFQFIQNIIEVEDLKS